MRPKAPHYVSPAIEIEFVQNLGPRLDYLRLVFTSQNADEEAWEDP